jgi:ATP-dependent Clp protease ATP-binding subunit ClpC
MYQHLSETAKDVLKLAETLAQNDHKEYVGTEHVLKAIMDHGLGIGAQVLQSCSVSTEVLTDQLEILSKRQMEETWVFGRLPGTPHFKQVIANAIEEAEKVNDNKVGTEYLLLGLLREKGSVAERALRQLGVDLELARQKIAQFQGRSHSP